MITLILCCHSTIVLLYYCTMQICSIGESCLVVAVMMYYLLYCIIAVVFMGHLGALLMHFAKIWRILFMEMIMRKIKKSRCGSDEVGGPKPGASRCCGTYLHLSTQVTKVLRFIFAPEHLDAKGHQTIPRDSDSGFSCCLIKCVFIFYVITFVLHVMICYE